MSSIVIGRGPAGVGRPRPVRSRAGELVLASFGVALTALAAAITASGSTSRDTWLEAIVRASVVGAPIAVGLYAGRRPPFRRFGALLVATGLVGFGATLSEASTPELYALGRIFGWAMEPLLIYLILTFPSGRLGSRADRILVELTTLLAITLYLPTALLVERYPEPFAWSSCHGGCPGNAFMVTASEPAVIQAVVRPLREVLLIVLFGAVTARVAGRYHRSSPLMRRTLAPVLSVAALRLVSFAGLVGVRAFASDSGFLAVWIWSLPAGVPLLAGAFLLGLARWRLFIAASVQRLATRLTTHPQPEDLRAALAEAFDDPALEIVHPLDDGVGWIDPRGDLVDAPRAGSPRCLTEIHDGDQRVAAIIHDAALRGEPAFIDAATAYAVMTLDNHRLGAEAADLIAEVQASRARIQATADDERRRIERDLHDGAQQRLVALRIKLELAAERIGGTDDRSADLIRQLGMEVDGTLDEVRSLARGIYPSPLADRGLVEGLRSAAMQAVLHTTVLATGFRERYPREIESAAYFCCLEALQNAAKHARGATVAVIDLTDNGALRFEVRDDGAGFDSRTARAGVGLTSMRDRLAAVGGELSIISSPGKGTRVIGRIPLDVNAGGLEPPGPPPASPRTLQG